MNVWRDTRLIVLVAQTAAVYAAILIPFKMGIPLVPGYSELRPANAIPIVASLLFGPAAAWGSGFGNLIGDCFGTLGVGSLFGFLGNFAYGYVPHLLWGRLGPLSSGRDPEPRSLRQIIELVIVSLAAAVCCAGIVAWGVDLVGLLPFHILAPAILLNNVLMGLLLAPPLLLFLHPRVKRWGLRYQDIVGSPSAPLARRAPAHTPSVATPFVIEADRVSFTYHGASAPALDGLTLAIRPGESVAVMGPSGAGKSTFCYALNGLIPHQLNGTWSGQLRVNGRETRHQPVWQQAGSVGVVFQDFDAQLISTNVERELMFPLEHLVPRLSLGQSRLRIADLLRQVGLTGFARHNPLALSGGQRQRLVIASTLVRHPSVVALDEPYTDLDPLGRVTLAALLEALRGGGTTIIRAEHDPEEVIGTDRLCILNRGRLLWEGSPRELYGNPDRLKFADETGVGALPLAECFSGLALPELPLTVEEAWMLADQHRLALDRLPVGDRTAPDAPPVIEVKHASYQYGAGALAVEDVTFTIRQGEFVAIIGRNGSGKSTLAALLKGLRLPTGGQVLVAGQDTRRLQPTQLATLVGYVFQNPDHQIFAETVEQEVAFTARNLGLPAQTCRERVRAGLAAVGLDDPEVLTQDPFSLTKGQRQRIAVASVLAARPGILIFDEPTTGLDAVETQRMLAMIRDLNAAGHTIIMITHALRVVAAFAHRCLVMNDGRIQADGPTRQVFRTLLDDEGSWRLGMTLPPVTRFAARWGQVLLTPGEVRDALRQGR